MKEHQRELHANPADETSPPEGTKATHPTGESPAKTRLSGVSLLIARTLWLALVLPSCGIFLVILQV